MLKKTPPALVLPLAWNYAPDAAPERRPLPAAVPHPHFLARLRAAPGVFAALTRALLSALTVKGKRHAHTH